MSSAGKTELGLVPWKTSDVFMGLVLVAVGFVVLIIVYVSLTVDPEIGPGLAIIGGVTGAIMLLTCWLVGPVRYRVPLSTLGLKLPASRGYAQLLLPVGVFLASLVFAAIYTGLVSLLDWEALSPPPVPEDIRLEGPAIIGSFAVVVLWGPLAEEVFFRGFIFPGLIGRLGVVRAAVASSLVFAIAHPDLGVIVPIFVTGMLLAWLYHKTGSLWSSFAAHALQNALAFSVASGV